MLNRNIIHEKFRYKTNDFNFRLGFLEETTVNRQTIFTRIDHWKNVLMRYCGMTANQSLMLHMNQISLDVFSIYFAAIECDINLVDKDADLIIHNLADTELKLLNFNKVRNYNYFDLADIKFTGFLEYKQQGTASVYGYSNLDLESHVPTVAKTLNISGNVLHTKLKNKNIVTDFFLPSLTKQVECHLALGYNDMDLGIDKIAHIVQKCAIDCISLSSIQAVDTLRYCCERRGVDIENLKMFFNLMNNKNRFDRLINFSSGADFDKTKNVNINNHNLENSYPIQPYDMSKNIISRIIKSCSRCYNFRIYGVFGEDEAKDRFIASNIKRYKNQVSIEIHQNRYWDFFYIKDLVNVVKYYIDNPKLDLDNEMDLIYQNLLFQV